MLDGAYRNRTVLVTGHTGFKGSWLSLWLSRMGARVIGYALDPPTRPSMYRSCRIGSRITSLRGDIRDFDSLNAAFQTHRPEIVFHFAAQSLVRRSYRQPVETYAVNVMGTVHVLEAARRLRCLKALIVATSDKCYRQQSLKRGCRESDPLGGSDPYSGSKACAEIAAESYAHSYFTGTAGSTLPWASVRAGNVIGGGDWAEDRLIPDCIRALRNHRPISIRNPQAFRPWQHVLEPLAGYLTLAAALLEGRSDLSGAWNFGPGQSRTVEWLVKELLALWGGGKWQKDCGAHPPEARYLALDNSKARRRLGWRPRWGIETALRKTVEWYRRYDRDEDMAAFTEKQIDEYGKTLIRKGPAL